MSGKVALLHQTFRLDKRAKERVVDDDDDDDANVFAFFDVSTTHVR
jgi:hypothetical protein